MAETWSLSADDSKGEIAKVATDCKGEPRDTPVMPIILMCCVESGSLRD